MDGLRPQRIKATKSKRIEPLVTPEAKSFREATGKLDNWTNHHRITDYLEPQEDEAPEEEPKPKEQAPRDNRIAIMTLTRVGAEPKPKEQAPRDKAPE